MQTKEQKAKEADSNVKSKVLLISHTAIVGKLLPVDKLAQENSTENH